MLRARYQIESDGAGADAEGSYAMFRGKAMPHRPARALPRSNESCLFTRRPMPAIANFPREKQRKAVRSSHRRSSRVVGPKDAAAPRRDPYGSVLEVKAGAGAGARVDAPLHPRCGPRLLGACSEPARFRNSSHELQGARASLAIPSPCRCCRRSRCCARRWRRRSCRRSGGSPR